MSGGGGFGGGHTTTRLVFTIAGVSILLAILGRTGGAALLSHLQFRPAALLRGELWQVVTYVFVYPLLTQGIFGFLISLYFLYMIGSQMEAALGSRRFLGVFLITPGLAALVTVPFAYLLGFPNHVYQGLWVALGALTVLFARTFAHQPIHLMFVLPVRGATLVWISFGILALYAIVSGSVAGVFPAFLAMLFALAFDKGLFQPRRSWLRFRAWRIERQLKRRTGRFSVIDGDRKDDGDRFRRSDGGRGPWVH
jgi:membrane associated rhomboid family serine protease